MREEPPRLQRRVNDQAISLAREWRMLGRAASAVALLTSPALFFLFYSTYDWPLGWSLLDAERALADVDPVLSVEEQVRAVLRSAA